LSKVVFPSKQSEVTIPDHKSSVKSSVLRAGRLSVYHVPRKSTLILNLDTDAPLTAENFRFAVDFVMNKGQG